MNRREFLQASAAAALVSETAIAQSTHPATQPDNTALLKRFGSRSVRIHDPSTIVKCNGEYWIFYTGRGVPSYRSKDLLTWHPGPHVFDGPTTWASDAVPGNRGNYYWAPEIARVGEHYFLFYCVSTFGKNVSAIGVASNPTLDPSDKNFHWTDLGIAMQSLATDRFNAIDPCFILDGEKWWLSFGSFWSGIKLIELDPASAHRVAPNSPMYTLATNNQIEASYIHKHGDFYYLIVNWGLCCRGVNSTYNMRIGRASKITGPYLDRDNKDMAHGGGSMFLQTDGPFIGPGQAGILEESGQSWISMHYYDGTRGGMSALAIRPLIWGNDGWPVVGEMPG